MRVRLLVLAAVVAALVAAAPAAAAPNRTRGEGTVTVDVSVKKFAVSGRQIVGRGRLTARLIDDSGARRTVRRNVRLAVVAQRSRCRVLTLRLEDLQLDLLGLRVDLSEVNLRIFGIRRGRESGVLGRLFCSLARSSIRLRRSVGARAHSRKVVRSLNSRTRGRPIRAFRATAVVGGQEAGAAQAEGPSCKVLRLVLGPLDLNLLGLVVELFGPNRRSPVVLTITAFQGQGVLGDLFCSLAGGPRP
ncbi:MAG: hypothetical protein ACRDL0_16220 [Thermoleophilaceae bacterium]